MFGDVIGVETGAVIAFDEPEPRRVEVAQALPAAVDMIENAEFHRPLPLTARALGLTGRSLSTSIRHVYGRNHAPVFGRRRRCSCISRFRSRCLGASAI